jgi:hypothetical protein
VTWFKVDDGLCTHPKWLAVPPAARGLWVTAGSWCSSQLTDGFVPRGALALLCGRPRDAAELVKVGLWDEVDGGWQFHAWFEFQPSRSQVEAARGIARRRSALNHDTGLRDLVRARDGDLCRYCGVTVNWRDRRSPTGGTYDHVQPVSQGGDDSFDNIVAACRACNLTKGPRTPDQAGMSLLPAPIKPVSSPDLAPTQKTRPDPSRRDPLPPVRQGRQTKRDPDVRPPIPDVAEVLALRAVEEPTRMPDDLRNRRMEAK